MELDPWLVGAAAARPERAALEGAQGSLTYAELLARVRDVAGALAGRGVGRGDRVALALPAGIDFAVALHACLGLGATAQPVDLRLADEERARRARGAKLVLDALPETDGAPAASVLAAADDGEVATVMHTSGTSSEPRSIELTHGNWLWNAMGSALVLGLDPDERWLCALPLAHVGGLSILIRSAAYGTTAILHERFDAEWVTRALMEEDVTLVSLVPTMLARLLDAGLERPPALRWALLGGAAVPAPLLERARAAGVSVAASYGLTETCSQVVTAGRVLAGARVELAPDGEILVSGPTVAARALGPDGRLHTGDLGAWDEHGRLTVIGRKAETIVSGGENVAPTEVEDVLLAHPAVAEAAVFGRPDPEWGEAVTAAVVLRPGSVASATELRELCAGRLARFKAPKDVTFVSELPRTASGKLLRRALR